MGRGEEEDLGSKKKISSKNTLLIVSYPEGNCLGRNQREKESQSLLGRGHPARFSGVDAIGAGQLFPLFPL